LIIYIVQKNLDPSHPKTIKQTMMDAANDASKQADNTATTPQESAAAAQPEPQAQPQAA